MWSRSPRWPVVALVLAGVVLLAGGATVWWLVQRDDGVTDESWALLGTREQGRVLLVRGPDHGVCDDISVAISSVSDDEIVVSATNRPDVPDGDEDEVVVCPAILLAGETVAFRLAEPIAGRRVTGRRRTLRPPYDRDHRGRARGPVIAETLRVPGTAPPSVVGLRYQDARDALCNAGFEARRVAGDRTGPVTAQGRPARQRMRGAARFATCTNGMLPVVSLTTGS